MIRATNDDMGDDVGEPGTVGENVLRNEREVAQQALAMGLKKDFALNLQQPPHERHFAERTDLPVDLPVPVPQGGYRVLLRPLGAR